MQSFTWFLGTWAQVLMLSWQVLWEPLPQSPKVLIIKTLKSLAVRKTTKIWKPHSLFHRHRDKTKLGWISNICQLAGTTVLLPPLINYSLKKLQGLYLANAHNHHTWKWRPFGYWYMTWSITQIPCCTSFPTLPCYCSMKSHSVGVKTFSIWT